MLKQDYYRFHTVDRSGSLEPLAFQSEITVRDKDHVSKITNVPPFLKG